MPRNPLKTFRRKSSGNVLDLETETAPSTSSTSSSFRVLERPSDNTNTFTGGSKGPNGRPVAQPMQNGARSVENLGLSTNRCVKPPAEDARRALRSDRRSAGTTHSAASSYHLGYATSGSSARHSSSSTLPSSFDAEADLDNGELYPVRKPQTTPSSPAVPEPTAPTFAARAGRALSFGLRSQKPSFPPSNVPSVPPLPSIPPQQLPVSHNQPMNPPSLYRGDSDYSRDRAMTTSSYASTARPPQLDNADFGGDGGFDNMFENLSRERTKSKEEIPPVPPLNTYQPQRTPSPFMTRTSSRQDDPSPTLLERPKFPDERRYSWDSRKSSEQLISAPSSTVGSPASEKFPNVSPMPGFSAVRGYQAVPNRYASPDPPNIQHLSSIRGSDETDDVLNADAYESKAVWRSELRRPTGERDDQLMTAPQEFAQQTSSPSGIRAVNTSSPLRTQPNASIQRPVTSASVARDSPNATPRAKKLDLENEEELLFGDSPAAPTSRVLNPGKQRADLSDTPKRMTRAQFEQAQKVSRPYSHHDEEDDRRSDGEGSDDEDDADRARQMAAQRRRQEATMSVYRQQMKKVTGGQPSDLPSQPSRPSFDRSGTSGMTASMSSMSLGLPTVGEDEDDDVPLGILQAHGFPTKTRPPSQQPGASPGYAGSVAGGAGGNLPPFASRLPVDPYFGASLVNPANRESLAYGNGGGSVYGGPAPPQPGGLVGVIAGEERAKAARRGSPNPVTGEYGPIPMPGAMQNQQMPSFQRSSSMASLMSPPAPMGGFYPQNGFMPGMPPMSPAEQANMNTQHQMAQMMQMQHQMWQQMMAMQSGQPMPQMQMPGFPGLQQGQSMNNLQGGLAMNGQRPMSGVSNYAPSIGAAGRTKSMTNLANFGNHHNNDHMQPRSNTMGSSSLLNIPNYAGSVYGMNVGPNGPGQGYTPSIAPSERSNIGMPSRYRPVSVMDGFESQTEVGAPNRTTPSPGPSPLAAMNGNVTNQPKNTIRVIDKPKGAPRTMSSLFGRAPKPVEDDDDEEGWAEMARKKQEMKKKRATKNASNEPALSDLYQGLE